MPLNFKQEALSAFSELLDAIEGGRIQSITWKPIRGKNNFECRVTLPGGAASWTTGVMGQHDVSKMWEESIKGALSLDRAGRAIDAKLAAGEPIL